MEDNSVKCVKIYQITSPQTDKVYVGSTTKSLKERFRKHKRNYDTSSKEILEYDDAKISLIEEVELEQRFIRERYWIEFYGQSCVNIIIPGRTMKEYYEINKEDIKEWHKEYHQINKQHLIQKAKEYYKINKEKINEWQKEKITCECGIQISKSNYAKHKKSKKHQDKMLLISVEVNLD